eukprot:1166104-Prorocentrum_minimum.AAC.1
MDQSDAGHAELLSISLVALIRLVGAEGPPVYCSSASRLVRRENIPARPASDWWSGVKIQSLEYSPKG